MRTLSGIQQGERPAGLRGPQLLNLGETIFRKHTPMDTKAFIRKELEQAELSVSDDILEQLVPMCLRWQEYIRETREIDPGDVEPAFDLFRF